MFWDRVVFSPCLVKDFLVRDLGTPEYSCISETIVHVISKICLLTLLFAMIIQGEIALNLKLFTDIPSVGCSEYNLNGVLPR